MAETHPRSPCDAPPPLLEMRNIGKTFSGMRALRDVRLDVRRGEVHALMGENGAGKSTLMKILSGAYQADAGAQILLEGKPVAIHGPQAARDLGIAVIYQELSLAPNLSVAENIHAGRELRKRGCRWLADRAAMERACADVLSRLGARFGPATRVGDLTIAERQLVEIARAMLANARILVMDEPTTPLSTRETDRLFALIQRLREAGMAIIYISHRMAEIYALSDRVSVLRDGSYVGTLERAELSEARLVKMMVGRDLSGFYRKAHRFAGDAPVALTVRDLADGARVHGCSFVLHEGEVLGLAGLVGAGRTELARLIYGARKRSAGTVEVEGGKSLQPRSPRDAIRAGVVYLTEDRKGDGLFLDMSVHDNINVMIAGRDARAGVLDRRKAAGRTGAAVDALAIRVARASANVGSLSGGNQQKVLLSRLLEIRPRVLILDEPTRGVDIGAKSEIYRIIDQLARSGVAILVISSELPEVIGVSDRVLVMREGTIAGELAGEGAISQEAIIELATGSSADAANRSPARAAA
ncbi:ribose ABC transporter ATP binding subunit [Paraburkholderia unamae]|uniref:sugar ABC transporter ATP-binding protein n=1 Tax=Paraburkholderia unamae TaxID=219649 RepID=UPI001CB39B9C|nr:sugar ABC transporter ATP-binding protein [Paraburkholderia unamae]CAG9257350.1 ribose ABC transporter ATP binding subunit [Paraburkholderia unamae]